MKNYLEFINEQYYSQSQFSLSNEKITEEEIKKMRRFGLQKTREYLNKNFVGFVRIELQLNDYYFNVTKWEVPRNKGLVLFYKGYFVNGKYKEVYGEHHNVSIGKSHYNFGSITKVNVKEPIRKPDIDPFGEEIWFE